MAARATIHQVVLLVTVWLTGCASSRTADAPAAPPAPAAPAPSDTVDSSATGQVAAASTEAPSSSPSQPSDVIRQGRDWTARFYQREIPAIWGNMTEEVKRALGTEQNLATFRAQSEAQLGTETKVVEEKTTTAGEFQVYVRKATFSNVGMPVNVQWVIDPKGRIAGFRIQPSGP